MDARSLETQGFDHSGGTADQAPVKYCVTQYWRHKAATGCRPDKTGLAGLEVSRPGQPKGALHRAPAGIDGSPRGSAPNGRADHSHLKCKRPTSSGAKVEHAVKTYVAIGERADEMDLGAPFRAAPTRRTPPQPAPSSFSWRPGRAARRNHASGEESRRCKPAVGPRQTSTRNYAKAARLQGAT